MARRQVFREHPGSYPLGCAAWWKSSECKLRKGGSAAWRRGLQEDVLREGVAAKAVAVLCYK
jgi:hypothetical protein